MGNFQPEAEDRETTVGVMTHLAVLIRAAADASDSGLDISAPTAWAAGEIAVRGLHLLGQMQQHREVGHV